MKNTANFTSPLSKEILKAYNALVLIISKVSIKDVNLKKIPAANQDISIRDVLSYQIGWGHLLIYWYQKGLEKKAFEMPGEGFKTWDYVGLANHFYEKYHLKSLELQLKEFETVVNSIVAMTEKEYKKKQLDKLGVWDWCTLKSKKQWPLSKWIRVNTIAPYKKAAASIRKVYKNIEKIGG